MKLSKGIQFFAPPPELFQLYLSDNYYISIGSDFDPVFTVGENFIEGNYSFNASSSGTATDIDYTVSGNKITFTKNIAGIGYTDFNTVNVAVGGTFSSSSTSSHTFYVIPSAATQTTYDLTNLNLSAGNYAITVVAEAEGYTDSDASNSVNYSVQAYLAAPTIAMNADGKTLEITDVENATSYDGYVDGTLKTNVAKAVKSTITLKATGSAGFVYSVDAELTSSTASESITAGREAVLEYDTLPTYIEVCPSYYTWDGAPTATGASVNATSRKYGASNQTIYRITNITNGAIVNCPVTD